MTQEIAELTTNAESSDERDHTIVLLSAVVYAVLLGAYVVAVLWFDTSKRAAPHLIRGPDSVGYEAAARNWPWEPQAARAAPIFPLLLRLAFNNLYAVVLLQTALWGWAWHWLARSVVRCASTRSLRVLILFVLLGLSLSPELLTWNSAIASESISLTLVIATFACAITASQRQSPRWWVLTATLCALATLARDTNAILGVIVIIVGVASAVRRPAFRRSAAACVLIPMLSIVISNALSSVAVPPRWFYPLQENIVVRITPRADFMKFFTDRGMPQAEEVSAMREHYFYNYVEMRESPRFVPFRAWLRANGPRVYGEFVLRHLPWQTELFVSFREQLLLGSVLPYGEIVESKPGVVYRVVGFVPYLRSANGIAFWALVALLLVSIRRIGWRANDRTIRGLCWVGITTAILHTYLAFAADAFEIDRHAFSATAQLRAMLWVTALLLIDRWVVAWRAKQISSNTQSSRPE